MLYRLLLLISFVSIDSVVTTLSTTITITIIYYSLFTYIQPYTSAEFTRLEKYSIISYLITFFFLNYSSDHKYEAVSWMSAIIIIGGNLLMVIYLIKNIYIRWKETRKKVRKMSLASSSLSTSGIPLQEAIDHSKLISNHEL